MHEFCFYFRHASLVHLLHLASICYSTASCEYFLFVSDSIFSWSQRKLLFHTNFTALNEIQPLFLILPSSTSSVQQSYTGYSSTSFQWKKNDQISFLLHKNRNYAVENLIFLRLDPYLKPQSHIHPMSCSLRLIYFALPFFFSVPDSLLSSSHIFISNTRAISYIFFHYNNDQINMSIHTHVFHLKNTSYRRSCFNSLFRLFSFIFFFLQCVKRLSLLHQSPSDDYPSSASQQFNSG